MSKALIIAAGVLLAMIVIAFMTYSFRQLGSWATEQDQALLTEQRDKFNKEYEVYDKDLMYGVDVISCLNKAKSNNDQITDAKYVTGDMYDSSYEVKVKVTLTKEDNNHNKIPLEETITVYHIKVSDRKERAYATNDGPTKGNSSQNYTLADMSKKFKFLDKDYKKISKFDSSTKLISQNNACDGLDNVFEFNITATKSGPNEKETRDLLSLSDTLSEVVKNTDKSTSAMETGWTKAEFKSALYDLKTRKFTCSDLRYDANTGRVNYIEFTEM